MLSLPLVTPRDSHELWFGSSQPYRSSSTTTSHNDPNSNNPNPNPPQSRRNGPSTTHSRGASNLLASLLLEERALRIRKNNIATFGYSWIRPAGCAKTMLGMKEEEAERQEALAAAAAEEAAAAAAAAAAEAGGEDGFEEEEETGMERDLDDDIPDADADVDAGSGSEEAGSDVEGLVEEGEEGLEEEGYMERDLDDDIPEGFPDDEDEEGLGDGDEENYEDFDNQPDLDDEIPSGDGGHMDYEDSDEAMSQSHGVPEGEDMARDLDDDIPEAAENRSEQEDEWQHTDTDVEFDDEDDVSFSHDPFAQSLRASTTNSRGLPPPLPPSSVRRETPAQQRFLQRWSGGGDAFDSSSMLVDEGDLRASMASQGSRRSGFGRFPRRRTGGPRDSFG